MTCRRRYFSASACGSSRVLMIGRDAGGRRGDALPDVLGTLGQAERRGLRRLQHLARAADQLAGHQERQQHVGDPGELAGAHHEVVLVAAVRVARRVGVVLEQVDVAADALVGEALLGVDQQLFEHPLAGPVVGDQLLQAVALGGRVLGMGADVEVEPRAVLQEHVRAATPGHHPAEQVPRDLVGTQPTMSVKGTRDTELGLDPHDSSLHIFDTTASGRVVRYVACDASGRASGRRSTTAVEPVRRRNARRRPTMRSRIATSRSLRLERARARRTRGAAARRA